MPVYAYQALSERGALLRGESAAASPEELAARLAAQGLLLRRARTRRTLALRIARARPRPEQFLLFTQELGALIRAGLTVPEALAEVAERPDAPGFARVLSRVSEAVQEGVPLSNACARHPDVFAQTFVSALRTGERGGDLGRALTTFHGHLLRQAAIRSKLGQAVVYPLFLLATLVVILAVLFLFVLPRFSAIYADFNAQLPAATRVLMGAVHRLPWLIAGAAAAALAAGLGYRRGRATEAGRIRSDRIKARIPVVGPLYSAWVVADLARTLSTLLQAGTPLPAALAAAHGSLGSRAVAQRFSRVMEDVASGRSLADSLRTHRIVPGSAVKLIAVGEKAGNLAAMLDEVARFHEDQLQNRLARAMSLIEPAMMLLMGILVGGIIIVMYLPIFQLADVVK